MPEAPATHRAPASRRATTPVAAAEDLAWTVEQACANAWPSPRQVLLGPWLLRLSGGPTRRTNSVNPLRGAPAYDVGPTLEACTAVYAAAGRPLIFRVPSIAPGMAASLDRIGYAPVDETCTLFAELGPVDARTCDVELADEPDEAWLACHARLGGTDAAGDEVYRRMTGLIALPKAFAALRVDGTVASMAYGVVDRGLLVINSVATAPDMRGRGNAKRVVGQLMSWAQARGAAGACLQVVAANRPARALYASLGFGAELYRYHYCSAGESLG